MKTLCKTVPASCFPALSLSNTEVIVTDWEPWDTVRRMTDVFDHRTYRECGMPKTCLEGNSRP